MGKRYDPNDESTWYNQRTAKLDEEDAAIRDENLAMRPHYNLDGIRSLCSMVCLSAVADYPKMLRQREKLMSALRLRLGAKRKKMLENMLEHVNEDIQECEAFFDSDMFTNCTGFESGEQAIPMIRSMDIYNLQEMKRRMMG